MPSRPLPSSAPAAPAQQWSECLWLLPLTVIVFGVFLAADVIGRPHGLSPYGLIEDYVVKLLHALPLILKLAALGGLVRLLWARPERPLRAIAIGIRAWTLDRPMMLAAIVVPLALMPLLLAGFGVFKMLLPHYAPFRWDDAFAALDRAIFFDHQPWQITHAILGYRATIALDALYTLWVAMLSFVVAGIALFARRRDRAQFFLSFAAIWALLGIVGAYLGSSAGPCYTAAIGAASAPEYAGLLQRLDAIGAWRSTPLGAVDWQHMLWEAHARGRHAFGLGISAMPSIHNAIAVLYALAFSRIGFPRAIGWGFAALIYVGSIHLGWHYAVDGLAAAAATMAIWHGVDWYLTRCGYAARVTAGREPPPDDALPMPEHARA